VASKHRLKVEAVGAGREIARGLRGVNASRVESGLGGSVLAR